MIFANLIALTVFIVVTVSLRQATRGDEFESMLADSHLTRLDTNLLARSPEL